MRLGEFWELRSGGKWCSLENQDYVNRDEFWALSRSRSGEKGKFGNLGREKEGEGEEGEGNGGVGGGDFENL